MKFSIIQSIIFSNINIFFYKVFGQSHKLIPYKFLINVTDLCNSRCQFCDIWKIKPENEIGILEYNNFFKDIGPHLKWLALSGGEVTLIKYFEEFIDCAITNCKNLKIFTFTTNGLLEKRILKFAKYAKEKGLYVMVTVSLDGDKEIHDTVRGVKGNYDKCMKVYNLLKENNIHCQFGLTASSSNHEFISEKFNQYEKDIRSITFVHSGGIYNKINEKQNHIILQSLNLIFKSFKLRKIHDIIEKIHIGISRKFLKFNQSKNIIPCEVLNASAHILPNGDVKPCMFMSSLGNIKDDKVTSILTSNKAIRTKKLIKENKCPKCWMNCYSVHSIMQHPIKSFYKSFF